jgi:hypothetical protein
MATALLDWAEGKMLRSRLMAAMERNGTVAACTNIRCARFPGYERQRNVVNVLKNAATRWACHTVATAPYVWGKSATSCKCLRRSHDGRIGTVAATEKRSARFGGSTMATAPCGWAHSVTSCNLPEHARYSGLAGQSPLPEKDPHDLEAARWRLRLLVGQVSGFVRMLRTHQTMVVVGQSPLPKKTLLDRD